jgi:RsiW-degrading membrane proteinase PrsW (M82 family)
MLDFFMLLGEIAVIAIVQIVLEAFLDKDKHAQLLKVVNVACFLGCFYLLLQYVNTHILSDFTDFVKFSF